MISSVTKAIAIVCAVTMLSSISVWAGNGNPGNGNQGNSQNNSNAGDNGGDGDNNAGTGGSGNDETTMTQVTPLCTSIPAGEGIVDGVTVFWTVPGDEDHFYSYDIILSSHVGNTWTYQVEAAEDSKNLSHWLLGILPDCAGKISDTSPTASIGTDGSTDIDGVKWNTQSGTFTLVMDNNYVAGRADVWAKSSTYFGGGGKDCRILAPKCPWDIQTNDYWFD